MRHSARPLGEYFIATGSPSSEVDVAGDWYCQVAAIPAVADDPFPTRADFQQAALVFLTPQSEAARSCLEPNLLLATVVPKWWAYLQVAKCRSGLPIRHGRRHRRPQGSSQPPSRCWRAAHTGQVGLRVCRRNGRLVVPPVGPGAGWDGGQGPPAAAGPSCDRCRGRGSCRTTSGQAVGRV